MKKEITPWSVQNLRDNFTRINFPEYQREPTVWLRDAKQRLIDSMLRQFDIAAFYFYIHDDGSIDCVDGRQRIGAIMSFLGENAKYDKDDNGFALKLSNEIYKEQDYYYSSLDDYTFKEIKNLAEKDTLAKQLVNSFEDYELTIIRLSESQKAEEFNLQFTRLNLGTIINSGEKLHAMVGELRDECFNGIGKHEFLESTNIQTRRYSREQLAAQILAQIFSFEATREEGPRDFARTRHFDLQRLFKQYYELEDNEKEWIENTKQVMERLKTAFSESSALKNRAIVVSTVLLAYEADDDSDKYATELAEFIDGFVCRLNWQVKKGPDYDNEYRYLIDFQRHVTQASVEKPAVQARAEMLKKEFEFWQNSRVLRGEKEYQKRTRKDPSKESRP